MATTTHRAPWQQTMDRSGRTSEVVRVSIGMGDASDLNLSTVRGVQLGEAIKKDEAARPSGACLPIFHLWLLCSVALSPSHCVMAGHVKGYVPVIDTSTGDYVALINYYSRNLSVMIAPNLLMKRRPLPWSNPDTSIRISHTLVG